ncbi:serine/threonine protein kinase [Nocardiopsis sp. Huas11]|uniref:serine/threonine-protein kinase n=1 Tax=Nocardiopsis sp. Huas11 TaxID=2183912 RepID=UPI000EB4A0F7|nr:serine/threonine-protein kinase [Nocardiopsis sp. Huas11]RKS06267.1 serine/threonine protein kinase [Nocardiopsis sp. Huas11]
MQPLDPRDPRQVGPYRIVALLGAGGMGRVHLGLDPHGAPAAVKVVRAEYAYDPDFRARFAGELDLLSRVHGAHTPRVLGAEPSGRTPWMATEYVVGPSLHDLVLRTGPLPEPAVRHLARGVAQALAHVHSLGMVHLDLKPGNVMVSAAGPQVIDFGIARAMEDGRRGGGDAQDKEGEEGEEGEEGAERAIIGTPGYMSPEHVRRQESGPPSDVFALGGVLVHALTGNGPFGDGHPSAVMFRITTQEPVLTGVPASLVDLVRACLDKDPRRRPTAAQVLQALGGPAAPVSAAAAWLPPPAARAVEAVAHEYQEVVASAAHAVAGAPGGPGVPEGAGARRRRLLLVGAAATALLMLTGLGTWTAVTLRDGAGGGPAEGEESPEPGAACDITADIAPELAEAAHERPTLPSTSVNTPEFSADGRVLAVGSGDGLVLWDWEEETELARIEVDSDEFSVSPALSPNGCLVGYPDTDGAHVYHLATGEHTVYREGSDIEDMAFSPDGRSVAVSGAAGGQAGAIFLLDLESGEIVHTYEEVTMAQTIAFTPDGEHMAAVNFEGHTRVWEVESGEVLFETDDGDHGFGDNLFLPTDEGDLLYMAAEGREIVHTNFLTGEVLRTFTTEDDLEQGFSEFAVSMADDRVLASYSPGEIVVTDEDAYGMKVFAFSSGEELTTDGDEGYMSLVTARPGGGMLAGFPLDNTPLWLVEPDPVRLAGTLG